MSGGAPRGQLETDPPLLSQLSLWVTDVGGVKPEPPYHAHGFAGQELGRTAGRRLDSATRRQGLRRGDGSGGWDSNSRGWGRPTAPPLLVWPSGCEDVKEISAQAVDNPPQTRPPRGLGLARPGGPWGIGGCFWSLLGSVAGPRLSGGPAVFLPRFLGGGGCNSPGIPGDFLFRRTRPFVQASGWYRLGKTGPQPKTVFTFECSVSKSTNRFVGNRTPSANLRIRQRGFYFRSFTGGNGFASRR